MDTSWNHKEHTNLLMFAFRAIKPSLGLFTRSTLRNTAIRFHHGCGCGCGCHDDGIMLIILT